MKRSIARSFVRDQICGIAMFILVVGVSIVGLYQVTKTLQSMDAWEVTNMRRIEMVSSMTADSRIMDADLLRHDDAQARGQDPVLSTKVEALFTALNGAEVNAPFGSIITEMKRSWRNYRGYRNDLHAKLAAGDVAGAERLYTGEGTARFDRFERDVDRVLTAYAKSSAARVGVSARKSWTIMILVGAVGLIAVGFAITMFSVVRRRVIQRLQAITDSLTRLSEGDLEAAVDVGERDDEIGAMADALEVFRRQARDLDIAHRTTREAQASAEALARHDPLTGLPNRRLFIERLQRSCATPDPAAVFLIDLDHFKPINDAYGHEAGDKALCTLAERFSAHREILGSVARLGGDEFAVLLPLTGGAAQAAQAVELIQKLATQPIELDEGMVEVGATVGIALWPQDGADPASLLRCADLAMYAAKTSARGTARFFKVTMQEEVEKRAYLEADLRRAISADEITPFYQPLVNIKDGELVGFEVLARWTHAERGMVMPDEFIPIAEDRGLLPEMTYKVLRQACLDARAWPAHLTMSVNFSPSQLRDPLLPSRLLAILTETGMAPGRIEVEVTENALIGDLEGAKSILGALQALGMKVALDDFGTGYSSLYHLRELQFDKIKVDKSFVMALGGPEENAQIVQTMLGLAHSMGLCATAEGVETPEQWARLSGWGCEFGQGYLFGKPMNAAATLALVREGGLLPAQARTEAA